MLIAGRFRFAQIQFDTRSDCWLFFLEFPRCAVAKAAESCTQRDESVWKVSKEFIEIPYHDEDSGGDVRHS